MSGRAHLVHHQGPAEDEKSVGCGRLRSEHLPPPRHAHHHAKDINLHADPDRVSLLRELHHHDYHPGPRTAQLAAVLLSLHIWVSGLALGFHLGVGGVPVCDRQDGGWEASVLTWLLAPGVLPGQMAAYVMGACQAGTCAQCHRHQLREGWHGSQPGPGLAPRPGPACRSVGRRVSRVLSQPYS